MGKKKREMIALEESYALFCIPTDTIELTLTAKIMRNGKVQKAERNLSIQDVRLAIREAEDYIPPDAVFAITEEGKRFLEDLDREQKELCKQ